MKVYQSINKVQAALAKEGITKSMRNNQGHGYNFRGIDQVYNALSPLLAEHGLCILPRVVKSEQAERLSSAGKPLIYSYVTMEFDLVSAEDASKHTICTVGEAFDSGDKSMNKAMSAAYKYAAFQAFAIPTEGDNDADAYTHEPALPETIKISEKQVSELAALISEAESDITGILAFISKGAGYEVSALKDAPIEAYAPVKKRLNEKIKHDIHLQSLTDPNQ